MGKGVFCHICNKELREAYKLDGIYHFVCDTEWCPTDEFQIKIIVSPKKQEDGTYLSVF